MAQETRVQSQVESYQRLKKWYLIVPCLTLSIIRYVSREKWRNLGEGVTPSPTPQCSSYWKGSFRVANFTFTYSISLHHYNHIIYVVICLALAWFRCCPWCRDNGREEIVQERWIGYDERKKKRKKSNRLQNKKIEAKWGVLNWLKKMTEHFLLVPLVAFHSQVK